MESLSSGAPHIAQRARPVVKWAGGKQQLLPYLLEKAPKTFRRYIEPFFGGGALFFALAPASAIIADSNPDLINLYEVVSVNVEPLIEKLKAYTSTKSFFYKVRAQDSRKLDSIQRAARFVYLNRTCFNGLYRVNSRGDFNVPFGRYRSPRICDAPTLRLASIALQSASIQCRDYKEVLLGQAAEGDFVYLDPPYLPTSRYADFKRYTKEQFRESDHRELAEVVRTLHERGVYVLLTNSNHELVYELYSGFNIEVVQSRRNISCVGSRRGNGEDVIVCAKPRRRSLLTVAPLALSKQVGRYPTTRFMGSKQDLVNDIWCVAQSFTPKSVLDLFSGSGVVSYMFKAQGLRVFSNDYMAFAATFAKAMVQNSSITLTETDMRQLTSKKTRTDGFVAGQFSGLYFDDADNDFIDMIRANIHKLDCETKRALAIAALVRACMKKRPRGIFTYTGFRYDDGRRDLQLSLREQFHGAVHAINAAVFDNGQLNAATWGDALESRVEADLVYIDPPYFSPLSDNEYVRRYHFVEGLARDWKGVELQQHTKTRKFKSYPTPFRTERGAEAALNELFKRFQGSVLLVSYSSNSLPTKEAITACLAHYKRHVEVVAVNHRYSFGNQPHKVGNANNSVEEYLFVGS